MSLGIKYLVEVTNSYLVGRVVERVRSEISPCLEITYVNGRYMLNSLHVNYSYGSIQKIFDIEFKKNKIKERKMNDVLILGFGAGGIACLLQEKYKIKCSVTGVEIDNQVLLLARKYFNNSSFRNAEIVCADAVDYMKKNKKLFDLIIVDICIDNIVPKEVESAEFLKNLKESLQEKGMIIFNKYIFNSETEKSANKLYDTFGKVFCKFRYDKINRNHTNLMLIYEKSPSEKKLKISQSFHTLQKMF